MDELFAQLEKLWKPFQRLGRVLKYGRFSLFVFVAGGAGLLLTDQGRKIGCASPTTWSTRLLSMSRSCSGPSRAGAEGRNARCDPPRHADRSARGP
ncbi:MAG: hypothetical protein PVG82_05770, partial [Chromatiales bacterium]